jgi:hypothetical protein
LFASVASSDCFRLTVVAKYVVSLLCLALPATRCVAMCCVSNGTGIYSYLCLCVLAMGSEPAGTLLFCASSRQFLHPVYLGVGTRVSSRSFICLCSYICFSIPDLPVGLFHVTFSRFHSWDMGIECGRTTIYVALYILFQPLCIFFSTSVFV